MPAVQRLAASTCLELLRRETFGRVALAGPRGPEIVPVNFVVVGGTVVFATDPRSVLGQFADGSALALEVDAVDPERWQGWSVVARGLGRRHADGAEVPADHRCRPVPWAAGDRSAIIELSGLKLSGRRVGGLPSTASPLTCEAPSLASRR